MKSTGCQCSIARGYPHDREGSVVEARHLLSGGIRRDHLFTVCLCAWHQRSQLIVNAWTHSKHRRLLGLSLAEGSTPFHAEFGDDDALLARQHAQINDTARRAA